MSYDAVPDEELMLRVVQGNRTAMEPLVRRFWDKSILPYAGEYDPVTVSEGYLEEQLLRCGIEITPEMRAALDAEKGE